MTLRVLCLNILFIVFTFGVNAQQNTFKPFKHYNKRVAIFKQQKPINSENIVMLGNSLTEYAGDWNKLFNTKNVINRGIAGDVAMGIYARLDDILNGKPKAIFLLVGANDISHNLSPTEVANLCKQVINKIRTKSPETQLFVQSLLPINEDFGNWKLLEGKTDYFPAVNKIIKEYCETNNITYIDLFSKFVRHGTNDMRRELTSDGLHLSPIGYKIWGFELQQYINKLQKQ